MTDFSLDCEGGRIRGSINKMPCSKDSKEQNFIEDLFDPDTCAWLMSIHVKPSERGKGTAYYMLSEFENACREKGVTEIVGSLLSYPDSNEEDVEAWYLRQGFSIIKMSPGYQFIVKEIEP